jgi:DNA replication protein DnaC
MISTASLSKDEAFKARLERLKHGAATSPPANVCEGCSGTGWVQTRANTVAACLCAAGQARPSSVPSIRTAVDEHELRLIFPHGVPTETLGYRSKLEAIGVGRAEAGYTLEGYAARFHGDPVTKRHHAIAKLWIDMEPHKRSDLVLCGTHGVGKTGLAIAIARELLIKHESVYYTDLDRLSMRIRATFRGNDERYDPSDRDETERDIHDQLGAVGTLILDEISGARLSEFLDDRMRGIITGRQRNEYASILILNVDARLQTDGPGLEMALSQMFGPALYDRLIERGQVLPCFGPTKRQPKGRA